MQRVPARAGEAVSREVYVLIGERRPAGGADLVCLDEEEIPVELGVARHPEREGRTPAGTLIVRCRRL